MKARGATAKSGDVIPYVFCVIEDGEAGSGKTTQAEKARHPDDVRKSSIKIGQYHCGELRLEKMFLTVVLSLRL